ncbi:hypothetical protein Tco_1405434 [Tanacetum coccineum]
MDLKSYSLLRRVESRIRLCTHAKRQGRERDSRNVAWPGPINGNEGRWRYVSLWVPLIGDVRTLTMDEAHALRYLVYSGANKTYYDLKDMYGGHVWRRILLPMLPRSSSGYDTNWVIVDRLTKKIYFAALVDIAEGIENMAKNMRTTYHPQTEGQNDDGEPTINLGQDFPNEGNCDNCALSS